MCRDEDGLCVACFGKLVFCGRGRATTEVGAKSFVQEIVEPIHRFFHAVKDRTTGLAPVPPETRKTRGCRARSARQPKLVAPVRTSPPLSSDFHAEADMAFRHDMKGDIAESKRDHLPAQDLFQVPVVPSQYPEGDAALAAHEIDVDHVFQSRKRIDNLVDLDRIVHIAQDETLRLVAEGPSIDRCGIAEDNSGPLEPLNPVPHRGFGPLQLGRDFRIRLSAVALEDLDNLPVEVVNDDRGPMNGGSSI